MMMVGGYMGGVKQLRQRDGWMCRGMEGGSEALSRAAQSRLQMCRQQRCGCFGPHQAALGVSQANVPVNQVQTRLQAAPQPQNPSAWTPKTDRPATGGRR